MTEEEILHLIAISSIKTSAKKQLLLTSNPDDANIQWMKDKFEVNSNEQNSLEISPPESPTL